MVVNEKGLTSATTSFRFRQDKPSLRIQMTRTSRQQQQHQQHEPIKISKPNDKWYLGKVFDNSIEKKKS
jgi:hypothetical protein